MGGKFFIKSLQDYGLKFIWASCLIGVEAFEHFFNALFRDLNVRHFRVWAGFKWGIHTGIMCPAGSSVLVAWDLLGSWD